MPIEVFIYIIIAILDTISLEILTPRTFYKIITMLKHIYIVASVSFRIYHIGARIDFHRSVSMDIWLGCSSGRSIDLGKVHHATVDRFQACFSSQMSVFELRTLLQVIFDIWHQRQHVLISLDMADSISWDHCIPWVLDVRVLDRCDSGIYRLRCKTAAVIALALSFNEWLIINLLYIGNHSFPKCSLPL